MNIKDIDALVKFFTTSGKLKRERRRGWVEKLGMRNPESVADHTFRTVLISMVFSDLKKLDTEKVMKMALLHDLAESIVGDETPNRTPANIRLKREKEAFMNLTSNIPSRLMKEYRSLWKEFIEDRSREARLVRQIDKLEMALQALEYKNTKNATKIEEFISSAYMRINDKLLRAVLDESVHLINCSQ